MVAINTKAMNTATKPNEVRGFIFTNLLYFEDFTMFTLFQYFLFFSFVFDSPKIKRMGVVTERGKRSDELWF
jgi:hypothetical protein